MNEAIPLNDHYTASFPSSKAKRKKIIDDIINKINEIGGPLKIKDHELYLIIDEAVSNAMEHGNKWDPNKNISLEIARDGQDLSVTIEDEGAGFNPAALEQKFESTKPRGRGIQIIKHFCKMNWNEKGTAVNLKIKLG